MPQYSHLSTEEVQEILSHYDVGKEAKSVEHLKGGLANTNLKVVTEKGSYVLKICEEKNMSELQNQIEALMSMKKQDFPAAYPYPLHGMDASLPTSYVLEKNNVRVLVFDFLKGSAGSLETMNESKAIELGKATEVPARLHLVTPPSKFLVEQPPFPPGLADIDPFLKEISGSTWDSHTFVKTYLRDLLNSIRPSIQNPNLQKGLVHGDIFPDNCMFDGNDLVAVLDFEEACYEPVIIDIAVTISGCFFGSLGHGQVQGDKEDLNSTLNWSYCAAFLKSYNSVRKIPELEFRLLPDFIRYSLIAVAFWRFRQFDVRRPDLGMQGHYKPITDRLDRSQFDTFYSAYYADKVLSSSTISYMSTRGVSKGITFEQALLTGYAPDGGLIIPEALPIIPKETFLRWQDLSYIELLKTLLPIFIPDSEIPTETLHDLIESGLKNFDHPDIIPLVKVGEEYILEMFHGETGAFKDLALGIIGKLIEFFLKRKNQHLTIVVGTSGDTGSAAIYSVRGSESVDIVVLYPEGRISKIQELQMTTSHTKSSDGKNNVHVFACAGTSDDLDLPIKNVLNYNEFVKEHQLCSINSINWARVMIQIVHFYYAYFQCLPKKPTNASSLELYSSISVDFSVPTGACGDLVGGWLAWKMGLPLRRLIAGVNENDIVHRCLQTGEFSVNPEVFVSIAPSMDIQVPYNFERIMWYLSNGDGKLVESLMKDFYAKGRFLLPQEWLEAARRVLSTASVNSQDLFETIRVGWEKDRYLLDPHTAIGVAAFRKVLAQMTSSGTSDEKKKEREQEQEKEKEKEKDRPTVGICLATATPMKFGEAMERVLGIQVELKPALQNLFALEQKYERMTKDDHWETKLRQKIVDITNRRNAAKQRPTS